MAQTGMLVGGMILGIILFYILVYVIRSFLGPEVPSSAEGNRFTQKWSWNIFSPQAVDYEVCKKAGVMDSSNCATHVSCETCPECPSKDLATDCPAAGYINIGTITDSGLSSDTTEHLDEIEFLSLINSNLSNFPSADIGKYIVSNKREEILNTPITGASTEKCVNIKSTLEKALGGVTLSNTQVSTLTTACSVDSADKMTFSSDITLTTTPTLEEVMDLNNFNFTTQTP